LIELRTELQALEESARESTRPVELDQARVGRLSRMDAMQGQQMAQESARRRQQQLLRIEGALKRIESGEFGGCSVCGEEIDIRRLNANPVTTRCIDCMEE
jgi:DnaK suppressor protein